MSQGRKSKSPVSIEDLVKLAKEGSLTDDQAPIKSEPRPRKDIEAFIADKNIRNGKSKVHNLLIYELYLSWATSSPASREEFIKSFSYYFPKKFNKTNNLVFHICVKHKSGRFDLSGKHLKEVRQKYGKYKKKKQGEVEKAKEAPDEKIPQQISGLRPEGQ